MANLQKQGNKLTMEERIESQLLKTLRWKRRLLPTHTPASGRKWKHHSRPPQARIRLCCGRRLCDHKSGATLRRRVFPEKRKRRAPPADLVHGNNVRVPYDHNLRVFRRTSLVYTSRVRKNVWEGRCTTTMKILYTDIRQRCVREDASHLSIATVSFHVLW